MFLCDYLLKPYHNWCVDIFLIYNAGMLQKCGYYDEQYKESFIYRFIVVCLNPSIIVHHKQLRKCLFIVIWLHGCLFVAIKFLLFKSDKYTDKSKFTIGVKFGNVILYLYGHCRNLNPKIGCFCTLFWWSKVTFN